MQKGIRRTKKQAKVIPLMPCEAIGYIISLM